MAAIQLTWLCIRRKVTHILTNSIESESMKLYVEILHTIANPVFQVVPLGAHTRGHSP